MTKHSSTSRSELLKRSWDKNASAWTDAVRRNLIRSRTELTNNAILDAISRFSPARVLDFGCGEGWLVRELSKGRIEAVGLDGSAKLISEAQKADAKGNYVTVYYEDIDDRLIEELGDFDLVVCNFALMVENIQPVFAAVHEFLVPGGRFIIQTSLASENEGWREERFEDFGGAEWESMPWYQRSEEKWLDVLKQAGFFGVEISYPGKNGDNNLTSMIIISHKMDRSF